MPVKKAAQASLNPLLRQARLARGWTQQELADRIKAPHAFMINRWENGTTFPSSEYRRRLVEVFELDLAALGLLPTRRTRTTSGRPPALYDPCIPLSYGHQQALIGREAMLMTIKQQLCDQAGNTRIALTGLPGVGKTALVIALANDPTIQERFHDGILWLGLGPQPDLLALLSRWGNILGISPGEAKPDQDSWLAWLHRSIGIRQMLLVIDDAWSIENVLTCLVGGPNCSYLLTTRLRDVALQFAGTHVLHVPELNQDESKQLLVQLAPAVAQANKAQIQALIQATGGLPLALVLLGQHLLVQSGQQSGRRLQHTLARLQEQNERLQVQLPQAGLLRDFRLPASTSLSLQAIIGLSESGLAERTRQMLSSLAVFPAKPNTFPEEAALALSQGSLEELDQLTDANLVEYQGKGRYSMHQTIADYARSQLPNVRAEQRMAEYYLQFLSNNGNDDLALEPETANIIQALQYALKHDLQNDFVRQTLMFVPFLQNWAMHQYIPPYP